jgi:hypothetical protein
MADDESRQIPPPYSLYSHQGFDFVRMIKLGLERFRIRKLTFKGAVPRIISPSNTKRGDSMTRKIIRTTLGDLIAALSEDLERTQHRQQEVYKSVAYMLGDLLNHRSGGFKARNYQVIESMLAMDTRLSF